MGSTIIKCNCNQNECDTRNEGGDAEDKPKLLFDGEFTDVPPKLVLEEKEQSVLSNREPPSPTSPTAPLSPMSRASSPGARSSLRRTTITPFAQDMSKSSLQRQITGMERQISNASANSVHPESLVDKMEDKTFIAEALNHNQNLRRIISNNPTGVQTLIDSARRIQVEANKELLVGTSPEDECVYIVQKGKLVTETQERFVRQTSGEDSPGLQDEKTELHVEEVKPGECFGEVALIHKTQHKLKAVAPSVVFKIHWLNFRLVMQGNDEEQINQYVKYLAGLDILSSLSSYEKETLAKALNELVCSRDDIVFQAGDLPTSFYILVDGSVDVFMDGSLLKKIEANLERNEIQYFGDRALLAQEPRRWTVVVTSDMAQLLEMNKDDFTELLGPLSDILDRKRSSNTSTVPYVKYLDNMSILNTLSTSQKELLAQALKTVSFKHEDVVFRCGDPATAFYILLDGKLDVFKEGAFLKTIEADSNNNEVQHFGDRALLEQEPRRWTVKVTSESASALMMDRKHFLELLGPLEEIMASKRQVAKLNTVKMTIPKDALEAVDTIGAGRLGLVELCKHRVTGDTYALKSVGKGTIVEKRLQTNILREKDIWFKLNHPLILKLYATYNEPENLFFLMELAQGGDLPSIYEREHLYGSVKHTRFFIAGVVLALQQLHSLRILHRQLDSKNILISARGYPKLAGFHSSKVVNGKTSTTCGTLEYMAPEMLMGMRYTRAIDWWALGVLTFELLSQTFPFGSGFYATSNILRGIQSVAFPQSCTGTAERFVRDLLTEEPSLRLGVRQQALSKHAWLANFKWEAMKALRLVPPFKPSLKSATDITYFDRVNRYAVENVLYEDDGSNWDKDFAKG